MSMGFLSALGSNNNNNKLLAKMAATVARHQRENNTKENIYVCRKSAALMATQLGKGAAHVRANDMMIMIIMLLLD